ncbi:MAG: peptidoglycan-binding protein [Candidatus Peregrinibacteria bacterium]|nr:peptidoglycan-binding protein [Candidatus Peregrinibacteria bacterium]
MKKTKTKISFRNLVVLDLVLLLGVFLAFKPFNVAFGDKVFADQLNGTDVTSDTSADAAKFPYTKTFIISAYYSPLPCQQHYHTGSYASEIALNGNGTNGADGTQVFPGMIAAPKTYPFGTKMDIPGIGIVGVHDRGGAIVSTDTGKFAYDRLDIWMGFGDKGLDRAMSWGKKTVDVEVYGVNTSIAEQVSLGDYSASESTPNDCSQVVTAAVTPENKAVAKPVSQAAVVKKTVTKQVIPEKTVAFLIADLKPGDKGDDVKALQENLKKLNLFRTDISGFYGDTTKHAVFKFQQIQGLVMDENSEFAGVFGPKTRKGLNKLVAASSYNETRIASATEVYKRTMVASAEVDKPKRTLISVELRYGMRGPDVAALQKFLKDKGFLDGNLVTQYYGPVTQNAVTEFQKANKLISSPSDTGAGYVGPATLELINTLS